MKRTLDIDLYRDGFEARTINCLHNPLAAATGYFDRSYYFYYCYLYCLKNYYISNTDIFARAVQENLDLMGLKINVSDWREKTADEALEIIKSEIFNGRPVFICCKYNSLFYHTHYKNKNFTSEHGIVISGFNEDNGTFIINEEVLLRNIMKDELNTDIYFPLQVHASSVREIILDSSRQFESEDEYMSYFAYKIFSLSREKEIYVKTKDILSSSLKIFNNDAEKLTVQLDYFDPEEIELDNEDLIRSFIESLTPIFRLLRLHVCGNREMLEKISESEKNIISIKKLVINNLLKFSLKKKKPSEKQKEDIKAVWRKSTDALYELIAELSEVSFEREYSYEHIDISALYNNQAFEESISESSKADITGEGTHYLMDECVAVNMIWKKYPFEFIYKYKTGENDNISCCGQELRFGKEVFSDSISILGCSEYGSFSEKVEVIYSDGTVYTFAADFSDFFQPAVFGETAYWSGVALDRKNGKTTVHNFNSRLFAKRYTVPKGRIMALRLPNRKNIHIFAITAEKQLLSEKG
ncbi:hypothetical protein [uncultured Ruminococcus sp.]|uniref:hypothetical protein n=1 Tax=uncultured Ruminococcus sp. TaxID=165186 RepID=UPI0025E0815F|nr:hypothetical protein [uncultured Ruminococcus sp.]